jgi:hypothetical protein
MIRETVAIPPVAAPIAREHVKPSRYSTGLGVPRHTAQPERATAEVSGRGACRWPTLGRSRRQTQVDALARGEPEATQVCLSGSAGLLCYETYRPTDRIGDMGVWRWGLRCI